MTRPIPSLLKLAIVLIAVPAIAFGKGGGGGHSGGHSGGHPGGYHAVRGHVTKNGTYVAPHHRTNPDGTKANNWTTKGNTNPFTGVAGTRSLTPTARRSARTTAVVSRRVAARGVYVDDDSDDPPARLPRVREEPRREPVSFNPPDDETTAMNLLRMARELNEAGRVAAAIGRLQAILREFSNTKVAPQANAMLTSLTTPDFPPHEFRADVVAVEDGNTITVQGPQSARHIVLLKEVNAPEMEQSFGPESKNALVQKVLRKRVSIKWNGHENGQLIGLVLMEYRDINLEMLREGLAWHFTEYTNSEDYARAESRARGARIGLWADKDAEAPWEFRDREED